MVAAHLEGYASEEGLDDSDIVNGTDVKIAQLLDPLAALEREGTFNSIMTPRQTTFGNLNNVDIALLTPI